MCPCLQAENKKIEAYPKTRCGGHIRAAYGILGSSDLDQASPLAAKLQADFLLPLIVPVVRDGKLKVNFLQKRLDKHARELGDCVKAFLKMFGEARPYMTGRKLSTV